jgi:hypothetical protein
MPSAKRTSARFPLSAPKRRSLVIGDSRPLLTKASDLEVIARAFKSAGVEFIDQNVGGPAVRLKKRQQKSLPYSARNAPAHC